MEVMSNQLYFIAVGLILIGLFLGVYKAALHFLKDTTTPPGKETAAPRKARRLMKDEEVDSNEQ